MYIPSLASASFARTNAFHTFGPRRCLITRPLINSWFFVQPKVLIIL